MSMEHKAYLFDTKLYHEQVENIICDCCKTGKTDLVKKYIDNNYQQLYSPYTGEGLKEQSGDMSR